MLPGYDLRTTELFSPAEVEMDSDSKCANYHVRISCDGGWQDLSGVFAKASGKGLITVVYQHTPDSGCNRVHIHALLYQYEGAVTTFKDWVEKALGYRPGRNDWFFKTSYKQKYSDIEIPITESSYPGLITYMSKGVLEPCYYVGIEKETIDKLRDLWIDHKEVKEAVEESKGFTVRDLQGVALQRYMLATKEFGITDNDFQNSLHHQDELVRSVTQSAFDCYKQGLFKGRIHVKFIREVSEFVIAELYPEAFSRLVMRFWKF